MASLGMTVLLPLLMAYSLAGEALHEWAGIFMGGNPCAVESETLYKALLSQPAVFRENT